MAISFPTSLDNFTNPSSGNTLDSPSHSLQHSDINDAVEAMQRKVGVGTAVAGSASAGQVLTISAAGTSTWSTPTGSGLVLINTTSFTGVVSQSLNDVFTSTYANYLINFNALQNTSNGTIVFKYRTSGSDNSTTNYFFSITGLSTAGADNMQSASDTQSYFVRGFNTGRVAANLNIYSPQLAQTTLSTSTASGTTNAGNQASYVGGSLFNVATVFDGITFITSAGTMTGTIRVYGYNN